MSTTTQTRISNNPIVHKYVDLADRVIWTGLAAAAGAVITALATDGIGWEEALTFVGVTTLITVCKVIVGQNTGKDDTGALIGQPVCDPGTCRVRQEVDGSGSVQAREICAKVQWQTFFIVDFLNPDIPVPGSYDFDSRRASFEKNPYGNDQWNNCVIAARAHQLLRLERIEQFRTLPLTAYNVIEEYRARVTFSIRQRMAYQTG